VGNAVLTVRELHERIGGGQNSRNIYRRPTSLLIVPPGGMNSSHAPTLVMSLLFVAHVCG